jgi:hypothetical protein
MASEPPVPEHSPAPGRLLWVALVLAVLIGLLVGLQLADDHDRSESRGVAHHQVLRVSNAPFSPLHAR